MKNFIVAILLLALFGCISQSDAPVTPATFPSNVSSVSNQTGGLSVSNISNSSINQTVGVNNSFQSNYQNSTSNTSNTNVTTPNQEYDFTRVLDSDGKLRVYYFYSSGCSACTAISGFMANISKQFVNKTAWYTYDINTVSGREAYTNFSTTLNLTNEQKYVPAVFFNQTLIWDRFKIEGGLEGNLTLFTK